MENMRMRAILEQFDLGGEVSSCESFGSGHINDTYRVTVAGSGRRYVLQRMNTEVFKRPEEVMENMAGITKWLRKKIIAAKGDPERETLNIIPAKDGRLMVTDEAGGCWRICLFIEDAVCYEQVRSDEDFYACALTFGNFQRMLADYPAKTLYETIPDFHNTPVRFRDFARAVEEDRAGRLAAAGEEVSYLLAHEDFAHVLQQRLADGRLPLRVTHNDTKLNNIMFDRHTGRAICVIDLDTVMPGLSAMDFGDAIRFGASTGLEDEPDLEKVNFDRHLYEVYVKGFIQGCGGALTKEEIRMLPWGALVITYEQALRFLGDYLNKDPYYKVDYPEHNLVRARTQIRLVRQMDRQMKEMEAAVESALGSGT